MRNLCYKKIMLSKNLLKGQNVVFRDVANLNAYASGLISFKTLKERIEYNNATELTDEDIKALIRLGYYRGTEEWK